ncbi:hypothetical protein ACIO3O_36830 [Streptomyces sp. NPDC087440]|uniref:hypothetical protein n=1 Tax=Streptomyces sp. NPDC087440 TaxID=3365790 RepID=UPI0037FBDA39
MSPAGEFRGLHPLFSYLGELPLEGWISLSVDAQLDGIGPSEQHPDLSRISLSVPPPEPHRGMGDPREEVLADFISRHAELGAGITELDRDAPVQAVAYRELARVLVPWLAGASPRDIEAAFKRGYDAAMRHEGRAASRPGPM